MTSQDTGGVRLPGGRAAASVRRRGAAPVIVVAYGVVWMHCTRGGVLLEEGWGYFGWVGPSCSMHNPWSVDPDPRGAGRLEAGPASSYSLQAPAQTSVGSRWGGPATEASGCAVRTPDSLLRGLVSTVLTLTGPASMFPAEIVGILRFFFVVRRRCACDVSTMDTHTPSCLAPRPPSPPGPPACPRFPPERVSQMS